jgi:hypothetical protein
MLRPIDHHTTQRLISVCSCENAQVSVITGDAAAPLRAAPPRTRAAAACREAARLDSRNLCCGKHPQIGGLHVNKRVVR